MRDPDNELRVESLPELRRPGARSPPSAAGTTAATARRSPAVSSRGPGAPSGSPTSTPSSSSTSARPGRRSRSSRARCAGSTGPRTRSTTRALEDAPQDAVLLLGSEPSLRWRTFCSLVTGLAVDLGVELVVTLGSLLADVTHTRPAPVTASATDPGPGRAARRPAVPLRGPDRHRRRRSTTRAARPHPVGVALGGRAALRLDDGVAAGREGALRPARRR